MHSGYSPADGRLATHHQRRDSTSATAVITMHVTAANSAGSYVYEDTVGADAGLREFSESKLSRRIEDKGLHLLKDNL
jgi:hypothetical protein